MKFNLIYPVKEGYLDRGLIRDVAVAAEEAGFYGFLSWDHYMLPDSSETLDAWSILSYLAGQTSRIKLGTVVTPLPFRPPSQLAKIVSTVDLLSGGRTILGVGAGWHRPEFDGFSEWLPTGKRVAQTSEALELITTLWRGGTSDFSGRYFSSKGAEILPSPVQKPHPPMWFGVKGPKMMELAALYGDGWIPTNITPSDYASGLQKLHEIRTDNGIREDIKGALQNFEVFTDASLCLETICEYRDAGCEYYGPIWSYPPDEMISRIHWFAENIMSSNEL
ncbi:MAG: LLM class flavin-dependent oxidoreductase [Chloroflexota bacterium]|nr:LLM class flavin-dependent oxidoreductase [Chloroflexota bacterium]MEC9438789.1 LLM class flavin-dependent oxidoreductase [Chloroflexota bacterium]MQF66101.1 LLM class flavin-dependent oxidoreductase [SAR202 cluster bacterium AC-647-P02_OGT_505m]